MELIEINLWLCVLRAPPWDCSFDVESGLARDASLPTCKNSHRFYGSTKVDLRHLGPSFAHGYQGYLSIHHVECYNCVKMGIPGLVLDNDVSPGIVGVHVQKIFGRPTSKTFKFS